MNFTKPLWSFALCNTVLLRVGGPDGANAAVSACGCRSAVIGRHLESVTCVCCLIFVGVCFAAAALAAVSASSGSASLSCPVEVGPGGSLSWVLSESEVFFSYTGPQDAGWFAFGISQEGLVS